MARVAVVNEFHMEVWGDGVPALFVQGSFGWGLETFPEQRALADQYQVVLVDRRGFGGFLRKVSATAGKFRYGVCELGRVRLRAGAFLARS
jgi:hypothetical protein